MHLALALLIVLVWGFNFVVIEVGLKGFPPLFLAFARFVFLLPMLLFIKRPQLSFFQIVLYGFFMFALQFALLFFGMYQGVPAGLTALIDQVQVFFTILLAVVFLKEKVHIWQVIGALIAFSGIGLVAMNFGESVNAIGFWLIIISAGAWSIGNLLSKIFQKVNMFSLVIWGSLIAWPPLLIASLFLEGPQKIAESLNQLSWLSASAVLYITFLSTLFGYGSWSWLLQRYPIGTIAPFTLLVPMVAMLGSILFLGEKPEGWKMYAGALVIGGLCINLLGPRLQKRR